MSEVVVLGGGPAGVTAALRARELGASVALVERGRLGGTCTNDGCVPTRALAKAARLVRDAEQFGLYGLSGSVPQVDFAGVLGAARRVVEEVHAKKSLARRLREAGVRVVDEAGAVAFASPETVSLESGGELGADRFIVCAGGHARRLGFPGAEYALTHSDVWDMETLPKKVAVVGAAATGCQLASVFAAFGSGVTLLDLAPRLLPGEDEAVSRAVTESFARRGIGVRTGLDGIDKIEKIEKPEKGDARFVVSYTLGEEKRTLSVGAVVLSVGWPGNVDSLGLELAGVATERGYVVVDDTLKTSVPHIYAAGDITGRMMLVQSATQEGRLAAEGAVLGDGRPWRHEIVPHGGFTDPEYASVGLTEAAARRITDCVVASVPYSDLDRGVIDGYREGVCKLVVERGTRRILGAHIVGEQAVEVVQLVATAMRGVMRVDQLADLELAYPTFTAVVGLAARAATRQLDANGSVSNGRNRPEAAEWELGRDRL
ncbi:dihydrolipoyl dehydrogenase family protein [Rubrobacter indicoceani]|uniref:dihydrolipoyl dehydrogenase family protein n=1 Tax=Rubrobacter indicoceani TaxID=2051957 RepID=UPI0013C4451B|nr:NAD(P)/FAD-dependent oxidoreductase [Rubrobacter indicoceani]